MARFDDMLAALGAGAAIPGLAADPSTAQAAQDARQALTDATRVSAAAASGFLLLGLLASLSLGSARREDAEPAV